MPVDFEVRPGETYEQWWCRVNEITDPPPERLGTIIDTWRQS